MLARPAGVLVANYPMSIKVLELNQADKDRLEHIIHKHQLPPSKRMMAALVDAFKVGHNDAKPNDSTNRRF